MRKDLRRLALENPIRRFRVERGVKAKAFAEALGVTEQALRNWEFGEDIPRDINLSKLATKMVMEPATLLEKLTAFQAKFKRAAQRAA
jgi:transcriptional regulator with XRE-family HTH domain